MKTNLKTNLRVLFSCILIFMLSITSWAMLKENIFTGGGKLLDQPWGLATLGDAYCGFLTFFAWVVYKERSWLSRITWFVSIMLLGNIAMSFYVLLQIGKSKGVTFESVFLRSAEENRA
jgi:hypothetical protein